MKKRLISLILTMCMAVSIITVFPIYASALESGKCGTNLTWTLDDSGTLIISGTGEMKDYSMNSPWFSDNFEDYFIEKVVIQEGVTSVGRLAFCACHNLKDVQLPKSLTAINYGAFALCENLETVNDIPENVITISGETFNGCEKLKIINLGSRVETIERLAFAECSSLESITLPDSITSIGSSAFEKCGNLQRMEWGNNISTIGSEAFRDCTQLQIQYIPESITSVGWCAFYNTPWYKKQPDGLIYINTVAYTYKGDMPPNSKIFIDPGTTEIVSHLFSCEKNLQVIFLPNSIKTIGYSAFFACDNLTDVYYSGSPAEWYKINIIDYDDYNSNKSIRIATKHFDYKPFDGTVDDYVIDEVKKYTSSGQCAQYNAIMGVGTFSEQKMQILNDFFHNNGMGDAKEGVKFLRDSSSYRDAYRFLTTNEIYGAYNYFEWMNTTKKGKAAQSALYASGLIFNNERKDYLDPTTYIKQDYPGVNKNKKLLKEIMESNHESLVSDSFSYTNKVAKFLKNAISLNNIRKDNEYDDLMDKIINCKSETQLKELQGKFADKLAKDIKRASDTGTVTKKDNVAYFDGDNFSKAFEKSAKILSFAGATADDILGLINLNNDIETYMEYKDFLSTIYQTKEFSFDMRVAACQLLDDIDNGYWNKLRSMCVDTMKFSYDMLSSDSSMVKDYLKKQGVSSETLGTFGEATKLLDIGVYISNMVVDTGDFVNQIAYTLGYAELATFYSMKLEEDKAAFLTDSSAENAWQFFRDYTLLWQLRYNGEKQYLKMNELKAGNFLAWSLKFKLNQYKEKEDIVNNNTNKLNRIKFKFAPEFEIPKSVRYVKKAVVKCPVNVEVYSPSGELIANLKDCVESDVTNGYGRFAVIYDAYSGEYSKIICQSTNDDLKIKMVAIGNGLVDYQSASVDSNETKEIDKLIVDTDDVIEVDNEKYIVDTNGDGNTDLEGDLLIKNDDEYIKAEKIELSYDDLTLLAGKSQTLGVKIYPQNTTNTGVEWISLNPSVAVVKNGVVIGVGEGSTNIIARVCDSEEIEYEMTVNVIDKIENRLNGYNFNNGILTINTYSKNNTSEPVSAVRYIGLYSSDNALKKIVSVPVSLEREKDESKDILINNYTYENGDYIKSFIWNSDLYPYSISKTLLLESN